MCIRDRAWGPQCLNPALVGGTIWCIWPCKRGRWLKKRSSDFWSGRKCTPERKFWLRLCMWILKGYQGNSAHIFTCEWTLLKRSRSDVKGQSHRADALFWALSLLQRGSKLLLFVQVGTAENWNECCMYFTWPPICRSIINVVLFNYRHFVIVLSTVDVGTVCLCSWRDTCRSLRAAHVWRRHQHSASASACVRWRLHHSQGNIISYCKHCLNHRPISCIRYRASCLLLIRSWRP